MMRRRLAMRQDALARRATPPFAGVAALLLATAATPAAATDVCMVLASADGFVALRSTPSATGLLVARTKPGEAVIIQKSATGNQITSGAWLRVLHFPGDVLPETSDPDYRKVRSGWMHQRYVGDCG
jgi:hypothetical protein